MSKQNLTISRENALTAYDNTDVNGRELLEHLFGKELFAKKDVTERVKTFEDACRELGVNNDIVCQYVWVEKEMQDWHNIKHSDLLAYLKLRIITAALNEGWRPKFTEDECRYYPWFELFTRQELDKMSDSDMSRVVGRANSISVACGGLAFAGASYASSNSGGSFGSRLAFKTRELADYAGRQFAELYADFVFHEKA